MKLMTVCNFLAEFITKIPDNINSANKATEEI